MLFGMGKLRHVVKDNKVVSSGSGGGQFTSKLPFACNDSIVAFAYKTLSYYYSLKE